MCCNFAFVCSLLIESALGPTTTLTTSPRPARSTSDMITAANSGFLSRPGNPPYLEYVRSSVEKKRERYQNDDSNGTESLGFGDRTKNQYVAREGEEKLSTEIKGNPNLVYESKLVESFEPTGDPVRYYPPLIEVKREADNV